MERAVKRTRRLLERGAVSVGFSALAVAVLVAYTNSATGYELSVYNGAPLGFWIGFGLALVVSVFAALLTRDGTLRLLALTLGGCSITALAGLPLIRGYFLHAAPDSFTHLGWIREIALGNLHPADLIYPAIHVMTVFISRLAGVRLEQSMMLVPVSFLVMYLLFVALSMRALTAQGLARAIGTLSAFLLLPINVFVTRLSVHPISQGVFYFALILFLFTRYVTIRDADSRLTNVGVLLALSTAAAVLYHPQQAAAVLVLFGTVSVVQFIDRRRSDSSRIVEYRPMYAQTVFLAVVFVLWAAFHSDLAGQMSGIISTIVEFIQGSGGEASSEVAQRGSSLTAIGSGLDEIFLKLFLVSAVYSVLAGVVLLASVFGRFETADADTRAVRRYVAFGFMVLSPFAFLHFVGGLSKFYFRYHATMMLIVTVLGALGLYYFAGCRRSPPSESSGLLDRVNPIGRDGRNTLPIGDARRVVIGAAIVSMLTLSLATVFPSPFIYQESDHVTEMQLEGHEAAFSRQDPAVEMSSVTLPHWRFRHATLGATDRVWGPTRTPRGTFDHNITGYLLNLSRADGAHYLVVTTHDRRAESDVYRGLRFTDADFEALGAAPHVNLVQSNGEFKLYYAVDERSSNATAPSRMVGHSGSVDDTHRYVDSPPWLERTRSVGS